MNEVNAVLDEVRRSLAGVDGEEIEAATELIRDAPGAVTLTGQGRSGYVATMTAMRLMHLGFRAHAASEATAPAVGAGDLLVVVSGSGATPVSTSYARIAKGAGARVLLVTRAVRSPIAEEADAVVHLVDAKPSAQPGGSLFEQSALLVLDAIVLRLAEGVPGAAALLRARHTNLQ
jgi:6-phospho-3-hexuloisomerase